MRRATSILLAVSLAAAGGMYAFQSRPAASGTFTGTISGGTPSASSLTATSVQSALLGELLSVDQITITRAAPGEDSIRTREMTYFRMAPTSVNNNARFRFNPDTGFEFSSALLNCAGCSAWTDSIVSRQGDRPPKVDDSHGFALAPSSAVPGTCGTTAEPEGTLKVLSALSLTGRTRLCLCSSDGGDPQAYAWLNVVTGTVGTSTDCNN